MMKILKRRFFTRDALQVAPELLGKFLVRQFVEGEIIGKIVEVEAYEGRDDPASHAYVGQTERNRVLFKGPGLAYVYFVYGMHYCFNVTTRARGVVLIRALEPKKGIEIIRRNRGIEDMVNLTNGPGKLTQALNITKHEYGLDLTKGRELFICDPKIEDNFSIVTSRRIGISVAVDKPWRFHISDSKFVSRK